MDTNKNCTDEDLLRQLKVNAEDIKKLENNLEKLQETLHTALDAWRGINDIYQGLHSFLKVLKFVEASAVLLVKIAAGIAVIWATWKFILVESLKKANS